VGCSEVHRFRSPIECSLRINSTSAHKIEIGQVATQLGRAVLDAPRQKPFEVLDGISVAAL